MDKIDSIEHRLERLEEKTKATFLEVERRLSAIPQHEDIPEAINERITEMEDLLLLAQIENSKLKERISGTQNIESAETGDINKRLQKLEDRTYSPVDTSLMADVGSVTEDDMHVILSKIESLESRIGQRPVANDDVKKRLLDMELKLEKVQTLDQIPKKYLDERIASLEKSVERRIEEFKMKYKPVRTDKTIEALKDLDQVMLDIDTRLGRLEAKKEVMGILRPDKNKSVTKKYSNDIGISKKSDKDLLLEVKQILEGDE